MLKNIWDTVIGNYRFIKYDGSQFHRGKWASIVDRPEMKVGLACVAFNCAAAAYGNNDLSHILTGNFDMVSNLTKKVLSENAISFATGMLFSVFLVHPYVVNLKFPKKDKAIDTHGTSLSRAPLSLNDIEGLKRVRTVGAVFAILHGINAFISKDGLNIGNAILFTTYFMAFERSSKILNGKYVICDEPPKKPQTVREKTTVSVGVLRPN